MNDLEKELKFTEIRSYIHNRNNDLYNFLVEKSVLSVFIGSVLKGMIYESDENIDHYFFGEDGSDDGVSIGHAFIWSDTSQGSKFWEDLDKEYNPEIYGLENIKPKIDHNKPLESYYI